MNEKKQFIINIISISIIIMFIIISIVFGCNLLYERTRNDELETINKNITSRETKIREGLSRLIEYSNGRDKVSRDILTENKRLREDKNRLTRKLDETNRELQQANIKLYNIGKEIKTGIENANDSIKKIGDGLSEVDGLLQEITERTEKKTDNSIP